MHVFSVPPAQFESYFGYEPLETTRFNDLVTAGITAQAGTPISFKEFMKIGLPVTFITLIIGFLWLLLRFGL